jgi:hypothetical protein
MQTEKSLSSWSIELEGGEDSRGIFKEDETELVLCRKTEHATNEASQALKHQARIGKRGH